MAGEDEIAIADKTNNNLPISLNDIMSPIAQKVSGIRKWANLQPPTPNLQPLTSNL